MTETAMTEQNFYMVPRSHLHVPDFHVDPDGAAIFYSRVPHSSGASVGARITYDSRCSVCGRRLGNEMLDIKCAVDFNAAIVTHRRCIVD